MTARLPAAHEQVTAAEPLPVAGLARHTSDLREPGVAGEPGEFVHRPPVRRRHLVVVPGEGLAGSLEERGEQGSTWPQHPAELREIARQVAWIRVSEGVPGHDAAQ